MAVTQATTTQALSPTTTSAVPAHASSLTAAVIGAIVFGIIMVLLTIPSTLVAIYNLRTRHVTRNNNNNKGKFTCTRPTYAIEH